MSLIQANAIQMPIRDESVQLCAFSPPYWGLRKYSVLPMIWGGDEKCQHEWQPTVDPGGNGTGTTFRRDKKAGKKRGGHQEGFCLHCNAWRGDLGLEPTPELYLDHMMQVMGEVWRVLRKDGVCFVNIGDSYSGSGKAGNNPEYQNRHTEFGRPSKHKERFGLSGIKPKGIPAKSLCLIPQKFAVKCQEAGWIIRSEIIWAKSNPMPESVRDRPTRSHEQVWMMTKRGKYYWDQDAILEPLDRPNEYKRKTPAVFGGADKFITTKKQSRLHSGNPYDKKLNGRNIRNVWIIATEPTPEVHFSTWPSKLVERMIRAASKPGDIVLDPFCGTGKTLIEAEKLNRIGIGLDLSWEYLSEIAAKRLSQPIQRELVVL